MTSFTADFPSNNWQIENNIKLGGDFSVVWLCYCELNSSKAKHLQNAKKNNDPVNKSRDCTELSQNCGYELCRLCYEQEKKDIENNPQQAKVQVNKQLIDKINEDIKNNRNNRLKKNNKLVNTNEKNDNNKTNEAPINVNTNVNTNPIPAQIPQIPFMPINFSYYNWLMMMNQIRNQDPNNPNPMLPVQINNQQQPKQSVDNNDKNKKEKEKDKYKEKDHQSRRSYRKHHNKDRDRDRRNKSRDIDSRSRSRNRSRSSRHSYSSSDDSKSDGRSKHSKSYK